MVKSKRKSKAPATKAQIKEFLNVGSGTNTNIPMDFTAYQQVTLDIDAEIKPDIVGDIRDMSGVEAAKFDGLYSSHNIEHVYPHEAQSVINEFYRVLKPGAQALIAAPDIQRIASVIAEGNLDEKPVYHSPAGPIFPIDIMYGHRASLVRGREYMAHKTAFTANSLGRNLLRAGFSRISIVRSGYDLWARAHRPTADEIVQDKFAIIDAPNYNFSHRVYQNGYAAEVTGPLSKAVPEDILV
ncbi:MAG: methyltransferase domain-containing protein [Pseudomonadales bacterium]